MNLLARKQATRWKIQWGGLVKKAGMDEEPTAVILGVLLEAKALLESKTAAEARQRWQILGDIALKKA